MTRGRRLNGEGSIYRRKDGRWVASISQGADRREVYRETEKEAVAALLKLRTEIAAGTLPKTNGLTVADFFTHWLADTIKVRTRPRTHEAYSGLVRLHVIPTLGAIKLQQLSPLHVQKLLREKQEDGLSANTVRRIRDVIRNGLSDALRWELVARNVAKQASTPRVAQREMVIWTVDEARTFLESIRQEPLEAAFVIALATGLRRGEIVGLRWQDIDLERQTLTVSGAVQRITGRGLVRSDPKTNGSRRTLPVAGLVIDAFRRRHTHQELQRAFAGERWRETGFVFTSQVGTAIDPRKLLTTFHALAARANVPVTRFHDQRHFFATAHLEDGTNIRIVQEALGHSAVTTTLAIYSHVTSQVHRRSAQRMGELLEGDSAKVEVRE